MQPQNTSKMTPEAARPSAAASNRSQRSKRRPLIGAIDQGTSSTRFLVFESGTGRLIESSQIEIQRIVPKEGWVEIDPNAIMASVYATIGEVHEQLACKGQSAKLSCIGICNQRESAVVWDSRTGKPLYNVIVWMDNRTKDLVDELIDSVPGRDFNWLKDKTGLPMSTYFSAFKLKWLIDNVPEVKKALDDKTLMFGTVDSWILYNLTGRHLTDVTNASRTFLMDIETLEWDPTLCKYFKVPMGILPKILASADDFGQVLHGPLKGLPITGVIGDQSAALFGHNCLRLGQTKATFGTGCFIMQNIGPGPLNGALSGVQREAKRGLITTVGYKLRDKPACYALEGSIKIAGAALTWLRDNVQLIENYEECDKLVNKTTHAAGVFFVPALGGLYSPYWDPNAAGLYIGLSQFTRREHLIRATFDSIAFQTNDILSLMRGVTNGLMIDGGLVKSDNLCQILADITGCDIVRPSMCETSALGAAMVAGCGANIWSFEQMLANAPTPDDYSSFSNHKHHYPQESLHYEDKFSSLIASKRIGKGSSVGSPASYGNSGHSRHNRRIASNRLSPCNLDAGGGVNDDAGGGPAERSAGQSCTSSYEYNDNEDDADEDVDDDDESATSASVSSDVDDDDETGVTTSGEYTATSSQVPEVMDVVAQDLETATAVAEAIRLSNHQKMNRFYATPSSGYSSGDNELTASGTSTNEQVGLLRDQSSPIPSTLITDDHILDSCEGSSKAPSTVNGDNNNHHSHVDGRDSPGSDSLEVANCIDQHEHEQQLQQQQQQHDDKDGYHSKRSSMISQTFPSNLSTCLRTFICPPETAAAVADRMHDDLEGRAGKLGDLCEDDLDQEPVSSADQLRPVSQSGRRSSCMMAVKPVDVFQSYISLEHRTDLVATWHRAVERSMAWTKIHHEEVRKIDYQRLSSLPISMYLFFSIGMVALSGMLSATK